MGCLHKAEATPLTEKEQVLEQFQQERNEEIQRKIALEQRKGKETAKTEPTVVDVRNTGKPEWEPSCKKRIPRKLKKYWNAETKAIMEEKWYDDGGCDANMLKVELSYSLAMTVGEWWEDNDLSYACTDEGLKADTPDDMWYTDEINHMTRSGRYFKPLTLDQPESSTKRLIRQKRKMLKKTWA